MTSHRLLASIVCAGLLCAPLAAAQGTAPGPALYALSYATSQFSWGCFGACACPIYMQSQIAGSFVLARSHADPLYTWYDVSDVRWTIQSASGPVAITGSGAYRRGGEFALTEQLTLDLRFGQGPVQRFDSGLKPVAAPFPEIRTELSLYGAFCLDSVLAVVARPTGSLSVDESPRSVSLVVGPNPSAGAFGLTFTLPRDAVVTLGVYDLAGRNVRALVTGETLAGGVHTRAWDGRRGDGAAAAPGLYLVRLETPSGRVARTVVRVR